MREFRKHFVANVVIIHGSYGYPEENWFQWLKEELEKLGCKAFVPRFPTPKGQNLTNWIQVLNQSKKQFEEREFDSSRA